MNEFDMRTTAVQALDNNSQHQAGGQKARQLCCMFHARQNTRLQCRSYLESIAKQFCLTGSFKCDHFTVISNHADSAPEVTGGEVRTAALACALPPLLLAHATALAMALPLVPGSTQWPSLLITLGTESSR